MSDQERPKIIVDDNWKSSAKAEKEKLAAAAKEKASRQGQGGLPDEIGFKELISLFATQALMYMGAIPDQSGRAMVSLEVAKLNIDLLGILQDKTKGNLDEDEQEMIDQTVKELRMHFVDTAKAVDKAAAEGKLEQMSDHGAGPAAGQMQTPGEMPGGGQGFGL